MSIEPQGPLWDMRGIRVVDRPHHPIWRLWVHLPGWLWTRPPEYAECTKVSTEVARDRTQVTVPAVLSGRRVVTRSIAIDADCPTSRRLLGPMRPL